MIIVRHIPSLAKDRSQYWLRSVMFCAFAGGEVRLSMS
jgi:hypothetical protein